MRKFLGGFVVGAALVVMAWFGIRPKESSIEEPQESARDWSRGQA